MGSSILKMVSHGLVQEGVVELDQEHILWENIECVAKLIVERCIVGRWRIRSQWIESVFCSAAVRPHQK